MSKGKYSPTVYRLDQKNEPFEHNARREIPPEYTTGMVYNEEIHFANYDAEGFDSYGYSAYRNGVYVGIGMGVDRNGYTEFDYLAMSDDEF